MAVAATGTVVANQMGNDLMWYIVKMNKEKHGSSAVVTDVSKNITAVRWKEAANAISNFTYKQPIQQVKRYCDPEKLRMNVEQPNIINQCDMSM